MERTEGQRQNSGDLRSGLVVVVGGDQVDDVVGVVPDEGVCLASQGPGVATTTAAKWNFRGLELLEESSLQLASAS